jgi:MYXO-CTERM domain-containing protein
MLNEFIIRIGTFCILIGVGTLILFIASDSAGSANFDYLFWALLAMIVGFFLRRRREPPPDSGRFNFLKRFRGNSRSRRERR